MAFSFNGSNQYCKTASNPITNYPFSMSAWFYTADANSLQTILHLGGTGSNEQSLYLLSNKVYCSSYNAGTGNVAITSGLYATSQWQHAAAVWSSATSRTVFLGGGNKATNTTSVAYSSSLTEIDIGVELYANAYQTGRYMNGLIAEPAIWNAALTDVEIASLAAGFTPDQIRPQSLQFYAPLVRDLVDVRGGRTITNVNSATVATHPRIIT